MRSLLACLVVLSIAAPLAAEPFVPKDDAVVLERLPRAAFADSQVRRLRSDLARDPENLALAVDLARRYLGIARAEGDPRWNGYAQAVLAPWWNDDDAPPDVLVLRATLKQNRHDFDAALADLERLLRRDPRNAQAWLTRAVILQVRGDFAGAHESCRIFQRLHRSLLSQACLANVAGSTGRAEASYELLSEALGRPGAGNAAERLWVLTSLADIATRLGRDALAESHFEDALALGVRDVYLLAAFADFLLDRDRPREVLELLGDETRSDALYLRRALAARQLGLPEADDHVRALEARFAAARRRGDDAHLGSEARFALELLERPALALESALRNWEVQKEPIDARLVLESALAAGRPGAAGPVIDWIESTGLEDGRLERLVVRLEARKESGP